MASFPATKSQLDACKFLASLPNYRLQVRYYLEGMCEHWTLYCRKTGEIIMPETIVSYFGKPGWEVLP